MSETPCGKCGWKYGFHICVDLTTPCKEEGQIKSPRVAYVSDAARQSITEAQQERREAERLEHAARDAKVVQRYKDGGVGMRKLAVEFDMAYGTVVKVLRRAQREGLVSIRKPNYTLSTGAK